MVSLRRCVASAGVLFLAVGLASPSLAQSGSVGAQSGVVVFWDAGQCLGGYHSELFSAHCEPGPTAVVLDFKTKMQFFCINDGAVDIRWAIPADAKPGPPIPPNQIAWRPECWKAPLGFDVDPNATIFTPQYTQTPPPNYYMTMDVVVFYDAAKPLIKLCLVPLFPRFPGGAGVRGGRDAIVKALLRRAKRGLRRLKDGGCDDDRKASQDIHDRRDRDSVRLHRRRQHPGSRIESLVRPARLQHGHDHARKRVGEPRPADPGSVADRLLADRSGRSGHGCPVCPGNG